jgi:peptide/nickel transport system permease protein
MKQSFPRLVWWRFRRKKINLFGLAFVLGLFVIALTAPLLANDKPYYLRYQGKTYFPMFHMPKEFIGSEEDRLIRLTRYRGFVEKHKDECVAVFAPIPYSPTEIDKEEYDLPAPPSRKHLLGLDGTGRDVLARMVHGSRISLSVGFVAVSIYVVIGVFVGALAGYYGGKVDLVISRLIEVMICFPSFFLILTLMAFLPPSIYTVMGAIGVTGWPGVARLTRGEFLRLRGQDFVTAAKAQGEGDFRTIFRHILPNALAPVLVSATFGVAGAILVESSLSFLGFGVPIPTPSWGETLSQSRNYLPLGWWLTVFPGLMIFLTVTAYNVVGEGLRDAIDVRIS